MNEFTMMKYMNETTIIYLKKKSESVEKNEKIQQMLEDEAFFFKIPKDKALKILELIGVEKEQLEEEYEKLVSKKEFFLLKNKGINIDDSFVVKYEDDYNNIFSKKENKNQVEEEKALVEKKEKWYNRLINVLKKVFKKKSNG